MCDVRSTDGLYVTDEFRCYTLNYADAIFARRFLEERGFEIVANLSAHKHVHNEKDTNVLFGSLTFIT